MNTAETPLARWTAAILFCAGLGGALSGCTQYSVIERSGSAGFNDSFESAQNGLPANWNVHSPPIEDGDVQVSLDTFDAVDGDQSLKLSVLRARRGGGWRTAGLFQLRPAVAGTTYRVRFWLKNRGCEAALLIRSEAPKDAPPATYVTLGPDDTGTDTWREFEYTYAVPAEYDNIRFELTVEQPGTLWIDDVRIEQAR